MHDFSKNEKFGNKLQIHSQDLHISDNSCHREMAGIIFYYVLIQLFSRTNI